MTSARWIVPLSVVFTNITTSPYGTEQLQFVLRDPDVGHLYRHWWAITINSRSYPKTLKEAQILGLDPTQPGFDWTAFDTPLDAFGFPTRRTPLVGVHVRAQIDPRPRSYLKVLQFVPLDYEPAPMTGEPA